MSIFKNLFSNKKNTESSQPASTPAAPPPAPLPEFIEGMSLDIFTEDGVELLTGQVSEHSEASLTLERLPGWLSFDTCPAGSTVFVRGYNRRMQSFNLRATVVESSRIVMKVADMVVEYTPNLRKNFRLPINGTASIFREDDERFSRPEQCLLVDLSIGGACIESEYVHAEEEVVLLRFKLDDYPTMTFKGQIIRGAEHKDNRYRYGVLFAQLTREELTNLTRTLYNIQTGNRQIWDRNKIGTWG